jgi:RHS repeat-associated protein
MDEGGILERVLSLPGGASVTVRADEEVWSYPNLQGSVAATADGQGAKTGGTFTYDPFGRPLNGHPDNREGDLDGGWLGSVGREGGAGGGLIEMGARVHSPLLGRFLQVDPVRGGSANDYDYTNGDPINFTDRTGTDPRPHYRCRLRGTCSTPNISGTFRFGLHRGLSFPNHLKGWETGPVWLRAQKLDAANRRFNQYLAFMAQDLRLRTWQQEVAAQNAIRRRQAGAVAAAFAEPLRPSQPLPDNPCHGFMCTGWKPDVLGDIVSCLEWGAVFAVSGPGLAAQVGVPGVGTVVTTGTGCVTGIVLNEAVDMPPNLP